VQEETVYRSKLGSRISWLSFDARYKTPFTSVGVGSLGSRAHYHLMKDEVTNLLHLDFFLTTDALYGTLVILLMWCVEISI